MREVLLVSEDRQTPHLGNKTVIVENKKGMLAYSGIRNTHAYISKALKNKEVKDAWEYGTRDIDENIVFITEKNLTYGNKDTPR